MSNTKNKTTKKDDGVSITEIIGGVVVAVLVVLLFVLRIL